MSTILISFSDELGRRISNDRGIPLSVPIPSIYPLSKESKTDNSCRQPSGALGTQMRESLKNKDFTFSSLAKLIGKSWRSLDPTEKERYVSQADAAKKTYYQSLAEYKGTDEYRNYSQYLLDFKAKQASESRWLQDLKGTPA
ncbi:hypothetical protein PLIIFM63780_002159 [Purpureocillium lilacinum]|nr:hypothetical protein PLIIFM63780_002159 [Purpureocillium lilacinum]